MPRTKLVPIAVDDIGRSEIQNAGPYGNKLRVGQTVRFWEPGLKLYTDDGRSYLATHGVVEEIGTFVHTGPPGTANHIVVMVRVEEPREED